MLIKNVSHYLQGYSTRYLVDTLGFETHMRQIRERRCEQVPAIWYRRPNQYGLRLAKDQIKGTGDILYFPSYVEKKDYEFEIAAYFPKSIKTADEAQAIEFVRTEMLFTIFNDTSSRDFQAEDMKLPLWVGPSKGIADKSFGPELVPAKRLNFDERGIPDIRMRLWVNDWLRCDRNFRSIYFTDPETGNSQCWGFAQVIAWFGKMNQGFEKGDLLGSGTVGNGSIAEHATQVDTRGNKIASALYPWLKKGDIVRMEAQGIGTLENTIGVRDMPDPREERTHV